MNDTSGDDYAERLRDLSGARWKRLLNVQAPYRWNLRRQNLGVTLDVGCGIGRNLSWFPKGSVGVDHNPTSIAIARSIGLEAYTVDEWQGDARRDQAGFDSILIAHVIEHMPPDAGLQLLRDYLPALRSQGKVFMVCPQERGYASDSTHVRWTSGEDLEVLARQAGLIPNSWRSFPFPRSAGRIFTYNEFNVLAIKP